MGLTLVVKPGNESFNYNCERRSEKPEIAAWNSNHNVKSAETLYKIGIGMTLIEAANHIPADTYSTNHCGEKDSNKLKAIYVLSTFCTNCKDIL